MPLQRIQHRSVRDKLGKLWLPRLWMWFVVLATSGYWVLATQFNPARVATLVVVVIFWLWMWSWYRYQHLVPELDVRWFQARTVAIVLCGVGVVWMFSYSFARGKVRLRVTSPDGTMAVVVTGLPSSLNLDVSTEAGAGLFIRPSTTIQFRNEMEPLDARPVLPTTLAMAWSAERPIVALVGDDSYVAAFDRMDGRLVEQASLRFHPTAIAAALVTPAAGD
jgi:hypothetical protein